MTPARECAGADGHERVRLQRTRRLGSTHAPRRDRSALHCAARAFGDRTSSGRAYTATVNVVVNPTTLAPSPDFRYVGFEPGPASRPRVAASLFLAGGGLGAGLMGELGLAAGGARRVPRLRRAFALAWRSRRAGAPPRRATSRRPSPSCPWGVLVEDDDEPRVLRWAAVRSLHVHTLYGRDAATPSTLWSFVTLETEHERFAGRTAGAVPLDGLLAHLEAYARETGARASRSISTASSRARGLLEPEFESPAGGRARGCRSAPSPHRLGLGRASRTAARARAGVAGDGARHLARGAARPAIARLDRRPLAAVLAAELRLARARARPRDPGPVPAPDGRGGGEGRGAPPGRAHVARRAPRRGGALSFRPRTSRASGLGSASPAPSAVARARRRCRYRSAVTNERAS